MAPSAQQQQQLTPTQARLFAILADGLPHAPEELCAAIDALATMENLKPHLSVMRRSLRADGSDVLAVYHNRKLHYQYVGLKSTGTAST